MASDTVLKGAIIGCGFFGQIQLEAWRRMPGVEIVAACDLDLVKAQASGAHPYSSAEELLRHERVDFLDIATRPDTHRALVEFAAESKLPVICQKPVATSLAEAVAMASIAASGEIRLMIHENWRWQPWYREAFRRIVQGDIGNPVTYFFRHRQRDGLGPSPYPRQPYFKDMPRLLIYETLVHYIDTATFLFGSIEGVYARTRRLNPLIQGEDGAILQLDHKSGVAGTINGNRYLDPEQPGPAMGEALIEGDESWIRINSNGDLYVGNALVWKSPTLDGYKGDSVRATQQHFIDCLRSGEPFETDISDYLATFTAMEASYLSAETGERVRPEQIPSKQMFTT